MNNPITKKKGDTGLVQVIADLDSKGYKVALPVSDHLPFDIIAISPSAKLARLSVKYREMKENGSVEVPLRTVYSNSKGAKAHRVDLNELDGFAIYCPTNKTCYYINSEILTSYKSVLSLRIRGGVDNDTMLPATDFVELKNINFK